MRKCLCGYETRRNDNFVRHLKRKTTWCDEVMVSAVIEKNGDEQMILFYYKMINTKKDFAIWMRNMRRVNQQFINIRDTDTQIDNINTQIEKGDIHIEKGDTQIAKGNTHVEKGNTHIEDSPIMTEIKDNPIQNDVRTFHGIVNKY